MPNLSNSGKTKNGVGYPYTPEKVLGKSQKAGVSTGATPHLTKKK